MAFITKEQMATALEELLRAEISAHERDKHFPGGLVRDRVEKAEANQWEGDDVDEARAVLARVVALETLVERLHKKEAILVVGNSKL